MDADGRLRRSQLIHELIAGSVVKDPTPPGEVDPRARVGHLLHPEIALDAHERALAEQILVCSRHVVGKTPALEEHELAVTT